MISGEEDSALCSVGTLYRMSEERNVITTRGGKGSYALLSRSVD